MNRIKTCRCGNRRIAYSEGEFLCEACLFRQEHPTTVAKNGITLTYGMYISSGKRQEKRLLAFRDRGRHCEACGATARLHVHHVDHTRLMDEMMQDLRVLCESCHNGLHEEFDRKRGSGRRWHSLESFTERFMRRKQRKNKKDDRP